MSYPVISADSHITEHPDTYTAHIDRAFRDRAPHIVSTSDRGDVFVIDGMDRPIALGLVAAAGKKPEEITEAGVKFEDLQQYVKEMHQIESSNKITRKAADDIVGWLNSVKAGSK